MADEMGETSSGLRRTLGLRDLTLLVIGAVIGSGIFIVPAAVLRQTEGSVSVALLVWLVAGVVSLLGALTYGELSAMKPAAGGLYVFIRDGFGRLPAFLYGWTLFFVIGSGAVATLAVAFSNYLGEVVPLGGAVSWLAGVFNVDAAAGDSILRKAVSVTMIAVVGGINILGTRRSANVQNLTTGIKVAAIVVMSAALLWAGEGYAGTGEALWPAAVTGSLLSGFGVAMLGVLWAYEGWQFATFSAGETINPQRNYPIAFLTGLATLIGLYMLANVAYVAALGPQAARSDSIAAAAVSAVAGPTAARLVAVAILISIFSAANSIKLTVPRVYYAMSQDGVFFQKLAEVHPRFGTPAAAVALGTVWAMVLAATGTFQQLFTYVVFSGWIFYGLAAAAVFVYRRREPNAERPYRVPGYPWTPLMFVLAAALLVVNTIITTPRDAAFGIGVVLTGVPVFLIWARRGRRAVAARAEA